MRTRAALLPALACLVALSSGCGIGYSVDGVESLGNARFHFVEGFTTPLQVAVALGPPQFVHSRSGELIFYYRLHEKHHLSATLRYYQGNWLHGSLESEKDSSLIVVFDSSDRLVRLARYRNDEGEQQLTLEPHRIVVSEDLTDSPR